MQEFYTQAFFAKPEKVLGKKLKPLTLGHLHALECIESAFVASSDVDFDEFVAAVWICSNDWRKIKKRFCGTPKVKISDVLWGRRVRRDMRKGKTDILQEAEKFKAYLHQNGSGPERWKTSGASLPTPSALNVAWLIMGRRMSLEDFDHAMDTPLKHAVAFCTIESAMNGDDSLKSEEEIAAQKMLKELVDG